MVNQSRADRGQPSSPPSTTQFRHARAHLTFSTDTKINTFISSQRTEHPFHITRPCVVEGDPDGMVTLYLQSSSGGVYRGDELTMELILDKQAKLHLTTQAGTIVHNTQEKQARQSLSMTLAEHSYCEYLPDPIILFSGAAFCSDIRVNMANTAQLMLSDSFIWHDPRYKKNSKDDSKEHPFAYYHSNIEITDETGRTLVLDRFQLMGDVVQTYNTAINGHYRAQGSIFLIAPLLTPDQILKVLRDTLTQFDNCYAGASTLPNNSGVIVRFLVEDGIVLQRVLQTCWVILREQLFGYAPRPRRK